jgi:hypothetical protein
MTMARQASARLQDIVIEGHNGTSKVLSFTVVRSTSVGATSVDWALDGMDAADLGGTLPPAPAIRRWRNHRLIEITLSGDRTIEADETLSVILSNPGANLNLGTDRASTTVVNDDGTFSITADQARATKATRAAPGSSPTPSPAATPWPRPGELERVRP